MSNFVHDQLPCGIEYAVAPLPNRHVVSFQIRMLAGVCLDPPDKLGLARLVEQTLDKGTARYTGRELSDAFDEIGAAHGSGCGRETISASCTVLPEHFERAVNLQAELLRSPTFPKDAVDVNIDLTRQELVAMEDDAQELSGRLLDRQTFGDILGRHPLGEPKTLDAIGRNDFEAYWRQYFQAGRMLVTVAGNVEPTRVADAFEREFAGFGDATRAGRTTFPVTFTPKTTHHHKQLEQQHIGICWPGVDATHDDFPIQHVMLGILSGGMGGRLFTEVREKQGLVYWVAAWQEAPRGTGMIFLGASTKPDRCHKTYTTLLREVDRLDEDIVPDELERAITGIVAQYQTRGDGTSARCGELGGDLFLFGRPRSTEEKLAAVQAVTIDDIRRYLATYPRDRLSVVTLGPKPMA